MTKVFCDLSGEDITNDDRYILKVAKVYRFTDNKVESVLTPVEMSGAEFVALKEYLASREQSK